MRNPYKKGRALSVTLEIVTISIEDFIATSLGIVESTLLKLGYPRPITQQLIYEDP